MHKESYWVEFVNECGLFVAQGQTILEACIASRIPLFHVCGGNAKCSTCRVLLTDGCENLLPPTHKEKRLQTLKHFPAGVRLACQTRVKGPVKLKRIIRDETDIDIYSVDVTGASLQKMGEEVELVLFFLDIRSFTEFVESHLAFDLIHIVRKLFAVFQKILLMHGGKIVETTGDGFYAIFQHKADSTHTVDDAVQCGYSILAALDRLNETYFRIYFEQVLQIGIGVHIGDVINGTIQLNGEEHLVVMGLPVNIAARLQNATKEVNNNFLVSSDVFDLLQGRPLTCLSSTLHLKGISDPLTVYQLGMQYT